MLTKEFDREALCSVPALFRLADGADETAMGAFAHGTRLTFRACVPRALGCMAVVLRIARDGADAQDLPFSFDTTAKGEDVYTLSLDTATLCPPEGDLFFYEVLFLRGERTLFTDSINNVDFCLSDRSSNRFRLLIYRKDFHTPAWFREGTMYHIFPDRFCRGEGTAELHAGAVLDPDWENGIPQYAKHPGEPLANNVFFGGNLWGVIEKLDWLKELGITVLYLSPVFEATSNHRYDTGDYEKTDALLGGDEAFDALIREAHARGIRVILDGVFNHTGDDSRYFNRYGKYPETGAYQSERSPYRSWYNFRDDRDDYECWWGIPILPRLNHADEACRHYFTGADGIAAKWLKRGADGWRLDVADELSDDFLDELRRTVKQTTAGEGVIIGEVWENAADKTSYGKRRRYLRGDQLDSVMNYPFRNAVLELLRNRDSEWFVNAMTDLYSSYPREVSDSLMNLLGTHDTERILTVLGNPDGLENTDNETLSTLRLTPEQRTRAVRLLKIASALQFTVFGVPSVYYGDEAGLEGYRDPFCRMPYPWNREDPELIAHYRMLGNLRKTHPALQGGDFRFLRHSPGYFLFERSRNDDRILVAVNCRDVPQPLHLTHDYFDLVSNTPFLPDSSLQPMSCAVLV